MSTDINVLMLQMRPFVKRSVTTGPGNVGGTTVVDAALTEPNDFWNGMAILIRTGTCAGQLRRVLDYDLATNTLTVNVAFSAQIATGVQYVMYFPTVIPTEDLGTHTNPRRYEKLYGFVSNPVLSGPIAMWAVGVAALNPLLGRTAGLNTTVYSMVIQNSTGAAVTAWLEDALAVPITPLYHVANNDSLVVDFPAGMNVGDMDLFFNASAANVSAQIMGTEE